MELIDPVNSIIIFLSQPTLLRWSTFLLRSQTVILTVLLFWIYLLLDTSICSTMVFPPFGNSKHVIVSVSIDFSSYSYLMPYFMKLLMTILVLIGMVFMIIWEMFHGMISLSLVLLLLLVNFVSGFRFDLMHISLIENTRLSLTHLHGFQLLVLQP